MQFEILFQNVLDFTLEIGSQTEYLFEVCSTLKLFDIQKFLLVNMAPDSFNIELETSMLDDGEEVGILSFEVLPGTLSDEVAMNICICLVNDLGSPVITAFESTEMLVAVYTEFVSDNSVDFVADVN